MPFTVVCVFPSQQAKLDVAPQEKEGAVIDRVLTEVNILQVRACNALQLGAFENMSFSVTKSFAINWQNVLEPTRFRHEHTTSETREIFAFDKEVNAVYFYSSAEILESVASSGGKFVDDKAG